LELGLSIVVVEVYRPDIFLGIQLIASEQWRAEWEHGHKS